MTITLVIDVVGLSSFVAENLSLDVPADNASFWINACMADYYRLQAVRVSSAAEMLE